jgi:hypothetical protein
MTELRQQQSDMPADEAAATEDQMMACLQNQTVSLKHRHVFCSTTTS